MLKTKYDWHSSPILNNINMAWNPTLIVHQSDLVTRQAKREDSFRFLAVFYWVTFAITLTNSHPRLFPLCFSRDIGNLKLQEKIVHSLKLSNRMALSHKVKKNNKLRKFLTSLNCSKLCYLLHNHITTFGKVREEIVLVLLHLLFSNAHVLLNFLAPNVLPKHVNLGNKKPLYPSILLHKMQQICVAPVLSHDGLCPWLLSSPTCLEMLAGLV